MKLPRFVRVVIALAQVGVDVFKERNRIRARAKWSIPGAPEDAPPLRYPAPGVYSEDQLPYTRTIKDPPMRGNLDPEEVARVVRQIKEERNG